MYIKINLPSFLTFKNLEYKRELKLSEGRGEGGSAKVQRR